MSDSSPGPIDTARLRRLARRAQWVVGVVLVFAVLGFAVAPPVARHYAVKILSETLGRQVSIEGIYFNPFTLVAEVRGARVMEADGTTPGLAFDRLRANLELESVVRGGPVLHELALAGLQVKLARMANGGHNWSDVAERLAAQPASDGAPMQFSVGNIQFSDARISIDDQVEGLEHELSAINFGIPFISNLPVKVDVFVEPSLSAQFNGQPLALGGRSKPFSADRETVLELSLQDFEIEPWLAYLPFEPAFKLKSGRLGTDLALAFSQPVDQPPTVALKGQVRVDALMVLDKADNQVVSIGEFELELADVQPLANRFHFSKLRLAQPEIDLVRLADGGINLQKLVPQQKPVKQSGARKSKPTAAGAKGAAAAGEAVPPAAAKSQAAVLDFLLASARVRDGVIRFEDRAVPGTFRARIEAINLDLRDLSNTGDLPAEIRLDYATDGGEKFTHMDSLRLLPFELDGSLTMEQLQPARYARYVAIAVPDAEIRGGRLDASVRYNLKLDDGALAAVIDAETLALNDFELALKGSKTSAVKVPQLLVSNAHLALAERSVKVGAVEVKSASVAAIRQRDGQIDLLALGGPAPAAGSGEQSAPWSVAVDKLALESASMRLEDRSAGKPVVLEADGISLKIDNFSTVKGATLTLALDSRINKRGKLGATGTAVLDPPKTSLKLDLQSVDLLPLQPYVLEQTRIAISRGNLTSKGTLVLEAATGGEMKGQFKGDVGVANFASVDRQGATDFVRWRGLNIRGIDLKLAPFALDVRDIALNDFYTRLILSEEGKLNLREIQPGSAADDAVAAEKAKAEAALAGGVRQDAPMPRIRIGQIALKGGNIAFSDRFVRPNYDANLTGMTGELSGLSSDPTTIAKLGLVGKVDNAAPVTVNGEFNPFRQDQYLNIGASVKDFELTSLSSYSGKYVGYGIQKGKLSAEINYRIEERKLSATNRIFLDQLTFGDAVESPDALKLPVQLAVSLLKNGRGEIDLDLPVSGTMDDPEFSVFGLVMRALINLVGKAITSPFALLGAAFGGGEELSRLEFDPGSAALGAAQEEKLGLLAKALNDRPGLRLDVTGVADPAVDLEGIKRAKLLDQVRAVKLKALIKRGESAPSLGEIEISEQEYPDLLAVVYDEADIKKERNLIGFAKRLPVPETEALLLAIVEVGDEDYKTLALQRGQGVRDWLVETGKVPPERIFLAAPSAAQATSGGALVHFALR